VRITNMAIPLRCTALRPQIMDIKTTSITFLIARVAVTRVAATFWSYQCAYVRGIVTGLCRRDAVTLWVCAL
jgi:hypothetical protein